jgi:hypothetical protein
MHRKEAVTKCRLRLFVLWLSLEHERVRIDRCRTPTSCNKSQRWIIILWPLLVPSKPCNYFFDPKKVEVESTDFNHGTPPHRSPLIIVIDECVAPDTEACSLLRSGCIQDVFTRTTFDDLLGCENCRYKRLMDSNLLIYSRSD